MLACLQRRQNQLAQHPVCASKILDTPINQKSDLSSMQGPRYPSAAELDAYAQKTADSPLSIKIFPSNIRVPQHKQISRTVNGLDTTGQRFSPYSHPYSGGYQGLLAIVKAPTVTKGVVKSSDGKRTKLSPIQMAVAPYAPPSNSSVANRHRLRPYNMELCKPPEVPNIAAPPNVVVAASAVTLSGGQSLALAPHSDHMAHGMVRQMARTSHAQGLQAPGEVHSSPSHQAATAVADSTFGMAGPPQSSLAYSGAVLPTQTADMAKASGYLDSMDYALWQSKQQRHNNHHHHHNHHNHHHNHHHHQQHQQQQQQQKQQQQQQQHYQQGTLRMYSASGSSGGSSSTRAAISRSPDVCLPTGSTQLPYRAHALSTGTGSGILDKVGSSPLNCAAMHGEFSVGQFFAPPWNSVLATPNSDCYNPQELPPGSIALGHPHAHAHTQRHPQQQQHQYPGDRTSGPALCCGLPGRGLCQASLLSSSLQSLECLISEIHPPCIKERMLGRGYEAVAVPHLLEHQPTHIQLPVFR
ncbi:protein FAM222A [Astyanax mexicanus]|uniref:protein FAM222A n=1 Tax=Astyanax mexicanus TaxID=7994 RepID=UPI0020CABD9C|nr:protein FAM222A [Astyanax mexicanus]